MQAALERLGHLQALNGEEQLAYYHAWLAQDLDPAALTVPFATLRGQGGGDFYQDGTHRHPLYAVPVPARGVALNLTPHLLALLTAIAAEGRLGAALNRLPVSAAERSLYLFLLPVAWRQRLIV